MCRYNHELCQHDLRGLSKHGVNLHYFDFVRNASREEREKYSLFYGTGVYKCKICGEKQFIIKQSFKKCLQVCKNGCNGRRNGRSGTVIVGYNDIATTHPHLAKQWHPTKNGSLLPTMVSRGNNKEVWWLCDECGNEWEAIICNRSLNNSGCPCCGDGMPYPEKLMALVLKALGIDFTRQLTYDNGKHKYDFYVALWKAIFETNGRQHYEDINWSKCGGRTLEDEQAIDKYKHDNAINNHGILEENYNVVDCRYSTLEWCRPNIEKALSKYIDVSVLTDEDWQEFDIQAQKSLKLKVCKRWKEGKEVDKDLTITDLVKEFGIGQSTVYKYLIWGNKRGLCEYNTEQEKEMSWARIEDKVVEKSRKKTMKPICLIDENGQVLLEAESYRQMGKLLNMSKETVSRKIKSGEPLKYSSRAKYDKKYIGCILINQNI